jgi:hypothetical protein
MNKDLYLKVELLQNMLVAQATDGRADDHEYQELRQEIISDSLTKELCPDFVKTNRNLSQFWAYIKHKFSTYAERRQFLWESFAPALAYLESSNTSPMEGAVSSKLKELNEQYIHIEWEKALRRKTEDAEGAITSARTMIETVCKYILGEYKVSFDDSIELPKLYKLTAQQLNFAPDQHLEPIFKQILGGCQTVVEGLGAMRNKLSDSHAKSKGQVRPSSRHAELAVNLAGAMSMFMVETFLAQKPKSKL